MKRSEGHRDVVFVLDSVDTGSNLMRTKSQQDLDMDSMTVE